MTPTVPADSSDSRPDSPQTSVNKPAAEKPPAEKSPPEKTTVEQVEDILLDLKDYAQLGYRSDPDERELARAELRAQSMRALQASTRGGSAVGEADGTATNASVANNSASTSTANSAASPAASAPSHQPDSLSAINEEVRQCRLCSLHQSRRNTVPGAGDTENVQVLVVGEAPGQDEDLQGLPFVGRAGQYFDKWLAAINLSREQGVYITNTIKCRPPKNRDPQESETTPCLSYLRRQIALLAPRIILCLGRISASILLDRRVYITKERGQWFRYMGIPLLPTYHPSAVLRNPNLRRDVWEDMKLLRSALDSPEMLEALKTSAPQAPDSSKTSPDSPKAAPQARQAPDSPKASPDASGSPAFSE